MSDPVDTAGARARIPSLLFAAAPGTGDNQASDRETRRENNVEKDADRSFARDLHLDQIVSAVAGDLEERDLITTALFRTLHEAEAVRYRQEVFRDLEDPALLDAARDFAGRMAQVRARLSQLTAMAYRLQREGWLLDAASVYCEAAGTLAGRLDCARPRSRALLRLRDYLDRYRSSAAFTALADDTRDTRAALAKVRYCTRIKGGRVDVSRYEGEADYSAVVLATFERFERDAAKDYLVPYRMEPGMSHIAAEIADLVARLFPDEFAVLEEFCRRHAAFPDEALQLVSRELQLYLAYLDYIAPMKQAGLRFCYPEVSASAKSVSATDTFDLALARQLVTGNRRGNKPGTRPREQPRPVVSNSFHLEGDERVLVVTGPNQGGKTTFARTFGQLHHLAGTGCPVPGSDARLFLPDRVFTHFEREEDLEQKTGKLEDDLLRIGAVMRAATADSVIVLNETFASTTTGDARFLGTKLLTAVMRLDALCVYVTFVDELAALGPQVVSMMSTVEAANPAERTFKVVRKPADGLAYALAIAEKYDLTYDRLRERLAR